MTVIDDGHVMHSKIIWNHRGQQPLAFRIQHSSCGTFFLAFLPKVPPLLYLRCDLCLWFSGKQDWDQISPVNEKRPNSRLCQAFSELLDLSACSFDNLQQSRRGKKMNILECRMKAVLDFIHSGCFIGPRGLFPPGRSERMFCECRNKTLLGLLVVYNWTVKSYCWILLHTSTQRN